MPPKSKPPAAPTAPTAPTTLPELTRLSLLANQLPAQKLRLLCEVAESLASGEVANTNDPAKREPLTGVLTSREVLAEVTGPNGRSAPPLHAPKESA